MEGSDASGSCTGSGTLRPIPASAPHSPFPSVQFVSSDSLFPSVQWHFLEPVLALKLLRGAAILCTQQMLQTKLPTVPSTRGAPRCFLISYFSSVVVVFSLEIGIHLPGPNLSLHSKQLPTSIIPPPPIPLEFLKHHREVSDSL